MTELYQGILLIGIVVGTAFIEKLLDYILTER